MRTAILLLLSGPALASADLVGQGAASLKAPPGQTSVSSPAPPQKELPLPGEVFLLEGHTSFILPAKTDSIAKSKPWVWYAPTLPGLPGDAERWMFQHFHDASIAVAGIDVGESYGSPAGRKLFSAFHAEMTGRRGFSPKPVLLARSRGGLMALSWAADHPDKVGGFAGIYPVCSVASYPGIAKAAGAYEMKAEDLQIRLAEHDPIDRLAPLARAGVPLFAIHGDSDNLVPLDANSGLMKKRYSALGGSMQLIVPRGQGHNMWSGFFQSQELVDFVKAKAIGGLSTWPGQRAVFPRGGDKPGTDYKLGASRVVPLPDKLPEATPLAKVPQTGVVFRTDDTFLQRLYDAAEKVCRGNVVRYPPPFDMEILIEGSGYTGAFLETQPMGGLMWGKRDLGVARNNQMIFMLNQAPDGQLAYRVNTNLRKFGGLQGYCFPTPAWELYFLLNRDREYLRRLYIALEGHDRFLWATRDQDQNGCLEALSRLDTGEDGSDRWPENKDDGSVRFSFESMDVMSYAFDGEKILAKVAAELGNGKADYWNARAESTRRRLIEYLWRPDKHACYDRGPDNQFMDVLIHNNLRCMYHGIFTQEMADAFIRCHLLNPEEFWTPMPLVSIAASDPKFKSVTHNNWSGQPQGLTFQRAIRALENYGHYAELSMIGEKLLAAVGKGLVFTQQFDPVSGEPNPPRGSRTATYGPTALSVLEYIAHLHGIELVLEKSQVWFSGLDRGKHDHQYTQHWNGHAFSLFLKQGRFQGQVDGRTTFSASANVRVVTDLSGHPIQLVGISPEPRTITIAWETSNQTLTVQPNHTYRLDPSGVFVEDRTVPFEYPYKESR